ncbi:MAG TPA: hypothetical protein VEB68_03280 [Croceibacterium sp.]|nr:hypothetical protein [Croceibacterium sp.]
MVGILGLFSRRNMLLGLGGAAAAGAVTAQPSGGASYFARLLRPSAGRANGSLKNGSYADWSAQVGSSFTAHTGHVLKLADVQAFPKRGARPAGGREQAFVARFDVVRGASLPEAIYRVAHPRGGTFELLLSNADKPLKMLAVLN